MPAKPTVTTEADAQPQADTAPRKAPVIDPAGVIMQAAGALWRDMAIRLPAGFVIDDIKEIDIWRGVQGNRQTALIKFDHVTLIAFDETWIATAVVAYADGAKVVLTKPAVSTLPERVNALPSDEKFAVQWNGRSFEIRRKSDNAVMVAALGTIQTAAAAMARLHPVKVA